MKIGVVGTIIKDRIYPSKGNEIRSFGGIFYTLSILGNLLSKADEIYPVCHLGFDIYDEIIKRLSQYKNIRTSGIKKASQKNTAVRLVYKDQENRDEFLTNILPPIEFDHIQSVGQMDIWLVNFITGFEMSLETFQRFCQQQSGLILMDFHSLSLDINEEGRRILRQLPNWNQWISGVDILQMNDKEAATLTNGENLTREEFIQFGKEVIKKNIQIFHITRGSKGSLLFYRNEYKIMKMEIPAHDVDEVVDVTGCGDAFAAGFLVFYHTYKDIISATRYANTIAGINCTIRGTEELYKLKKFLSEEN